MHPPKTHFVHLQQNKKQTNNAGFEKLVQLSHFSMIGWNTFKSNHEGKEKGAVVKGSSLGIELLRT